MTKLNLLLLNSTILILLSACSQDELVYEPTLTSEERRDEARGRFFGQDLLLFGGDKKEENLSVNPYLWQASLESLSFMGLSETNMTKGMIESQWYAAPEAPLERFKVLITVLGGRLRVGGARVVVMTQKNQKGHWQVVPSSKTVAARFEDVILAKARVLRARATH